MNLASVCIECLEDLSSDEGSIVLEELVYSCKEKLYPFLDDTTVDSSKDLDNMSPSDFLVFLIALLNNSLS